VPPIHGTDPRVVDQVVAFASAVSECLLVRTASLASDMADET
jgi:hypothetical protein